MNKSIRTYIILCLTMLSSVITAAPLSWNWWPLVYKESPVAADTIRYLLEAEALSSSGQYAPFWLQSRRDGAISAAPHSGNLTIGLIKPANYATRWWDYSFEIALTGQLHSQIPESVDPGMQNIATAFINRLYVDVRLLFFDVCAGIRPIRCELPDSELSSGHLAFSGNARGMPGISLGVEQWTPFPGLYGYLDFMGSIGHYWQNDDVYIVRGMIHYKYGGLRVGGKLPVHLSYVLNHIAQWGGYSPDYGDLGNDLHAFINAFKAGAGGTMNNDLYNAQGNHIGIQTLNLDATIPLPETKALDVSLYWQTIFEDKSANFIGFSTNLPDGLWGINIRQNAWPFIQSVCLEYLGTTDQTGPYHDRDGLVFAGNDNYYRNSIYHNGWNYHYRTIGTPLITSPLYNDDGAINTNNSRVKSWHVGVRGNIYGFRYKLLGTYSRNYGRYGVGDIYQMKSKNTALLLEVNRHVEQAWGMDFGIRLGADIGSQFGNTFGASITIRKMGIIFAK